MGNLFNELKRRNVVRVGIAYLVLGWVALQVSDILFDMFEAPGWVGKSFAALLLLGFPFACLFAWAFEVTPEGVKKTADVDRSDSITHSTGRTLDFVIIAALVIALGYFVWERQAPAGHEGEVALDRSIAVLPFVNMSSDQEQEWFADGLTEEILNSLARTPDILVASRTSSFQYKGKSEDISTIAAALGVAHILEGSVRRGGNRLRVTAQLIRASDGFHLWSETFDREPKDVIAIQESVAIEIANALKTAMDPDALQKMVSTGTASVAAYEAYLAALALEAGAAATGTVDDWKHALHGFEQATAIDENFSLAYWHQAFFWESQLGITDVASELSELSAHEHLDRYKQAINAAIRTASDPNRALKYKAHMAATQLRLRDARNFYIQFLQHFPNDSEGMTGLLVTLSSMRDVVAVQEYLSPATKMFSDDPLELSAFINNLVFMGLEEDGAAIVGEALSRYPGHTYLEYQAHRALLWNGDVAGGADLVKQLRGSSLPVENIRLVELRQACAEKNIEQARIIADELLNIGHPDTSIEFIVLQIMGDSGAAHQVLIDANLSLQALRSFLNYPYFDHTYFPELVAILERQSIDRPFISGPPYRCTD